MKRGHTLATILLYCAALSGVVGSAFYGLSVQAQNNSRYFYETGHTVKGRFLNYWLQQGELAQQGYPISDEMQEKSDTDGKTYTVQYFERAVFEYHPENQLPHDVLLSLLGVFEYRSKYPTGAPGQVPNTQPGSVTFRETGKRLGGSFLSYWQTHGGLPQQGLPISDEFQERSPLDGKTYTVQYFERAVFEYHPENKGTPYEVLLSHLGTFRYNQTRGELVIPPGVDRRQSDAQGSDDYLVWVEQARSPERGPMPTAGMDIMGIDLKTGRPFPVTNAPGNQTSPSLYGSTVVWIDEGPDCGRNCQYDIKGKDLRTGETFTVATGPGLRAGAVVAGNMVAWGETDQTTERLMLKNMDTGETTTIASAPTMERAGMYWPRLSEEYLVWLDQTFTVPDQRYAPIHTYTIRAYNLKTRQSRSILQDTTQASRLLPSLSLSGHKLVWDGPNLRFADLQTGEIADFTASNMWVRDPKIRGDTVLWITYRGELTAMKLGERTPVVLMRDVSPGSRPTIAGDWIAWQNTLGRLSVARLSTLFANPPAAIPTPVPTQPGLLPTPTRISTPGPDLTPPPRHGL